MSEKDYIATELEKVFDEVIELVMLRTKNDNIDEDIVNCIKNCNEESDECCKVWKEYWKEHDNTLKTIKEDLVKFKEEYFAKWKNQMNQDEILDYNIRCAKFLGWKIISKNEFNLLGENSYTGENKDVKWGIIEFLKFHSDWNRIHEVLDAIEEKLDGTRPFKYGKLDSLDFSISNHSVKVKALFWTNPDAISGNHWSIFKYNKKFGKLTKKEAVVQAVDAFLKWNEQQNK